MWVRVNSRKPFAVVLVGLVGVAWLSLFIWGASPYGRFLTHEHSGGIQLQDGPVVMAVFVAGWTLMTIAMMLPTSLPLIVMFHAFTARQRDQLRLLLLLLAGYLGVWTLFGLVAHLGDGLVNQVVAGTTWLQANHWLIGSATLVLAGVYQFTPLKYHCLDKCRSPMSFIVSHWQGRQERVQAFLLGVRHGLFCVGCCWTLMLLMFVVVAGSVGWMLILGAVMAVEKNAPWGRRLSMPLGVFLIGLGLMLGWGSVVGVFAVHSHS